MLGLNAKQDGEGGWLVYTKCQTCGARAASFADDDSNVYSWECGARISFDDDGTKMKTERHCPARPEIGDSSPPANQVG